MMRIGLVGIGFMGMIHYLAYRKVPGAQVAAICTRNAQRLAGDWRGIQGNFGPPGEEMDLTGVARYSHFHDLLADPSIDLVDICLPPDQHPTATVRALEAGKHVLVEKPISLTVAEAEQMLAAARANGKRLLVAHVLPFFPEYAYALRLLNDGEYGRCLGGIFKRVISEPSWLPDFFNPRTTGGPVVDLHVHDAHFLRMAVGMPIEVSSVGRKRGECVEFLSTQFRFTDPQLCVSAVSGVIGQQGRPFTHGFELHLEKATLLYESAILAGIQQGTGIPLTVLTPDGRAERPTLVGGDPLDAFAAELREAVEAITVNRPSLLLDDAVARDALLICEAQTESVFTGQPVAIRQAAGTG